MKATGGSTLQIRSWTEEQFAAAREPWQALLTVSNADPLFMSWDWQAHWWRRHARPFDLQLVMLAVSAPDGAICGLAPLHARRVEHRYGLSGTRLELVGSLWREPRAIFSEYLDIIAARGMEDAVLEAVAQWLWLQGKWDELVFSYVRHDSVAARLAARYREHELYVRASDSMNAWRTPLISFEAFVAELSSATRRKLFNQRSKLIDPEFRRVSAQRMQPSLERLERLAAERWSRAAGGHAEFHARVAQGFEREDSLQLTELHAAGECISVMLNIRAADTEYFLQAGFEPAHARGLSPGYLHMGYAIEAACRDGIRVFDFLGGGGMHREYKRDFLAQGAALTSWQILRRGRLQLAFRAYDWLSGISTWTKSARHHQ